MSFLQNWFNQIFRQENNDSAGFKLPFYPHPNQIILNKAIISKVSDQLLTFRVRGQSFVYQEFSQGSNQVVLLLCDNKFILFPIDSSNNISREIISWHL